MLDVLGVLDSIGDYTTITLKNGTEQSKRSLVLRDNSNRSIELTMWAEFASEPGDQLSQVTWIWSSWTQTCCINGWYVGCSRLGMLQNNTLKGVKLKHAASVDCVGLLKEVLL